MLPLIGDLNWLKDLVLPILVGGFSTFVWNRSGALLRFARLNSRRKQARTKINTALAVASADISGGFGSLISLYNAHFVIRSVVFLATLMATLAFYQIGLSDPKDGISYAVLLLAVLVGISFVLVHNQFTEITSMSLAHRSLVSHVDEVERSIAPDIIEEFRTELESLRRLAKQIEQMRQGRIVSEMLAARVMLPQEAAKPVEPAQVE